MNNQIPEPHTKLLSIYEGNKKEIITEPFFTVAETIQLMKMYSHFTYIAVQASRGADRCEREDHRRGMIHYVYLLQKAAKACLDIESKMEEWCK